MAKTRASRVAETIVTLERGANWLNEQIWATALAHLNGITNRGSVVGVLIGTGAYDCMWVCMYECATMFIVKIVSLCHCEEEEDKVSVWLCLLWRLCHWEE